MKTTEYKSCPSTDWLLRAAEEESQCQSISVGGLASRFGMTSSSRPTNVGVFGQLVEFARRRLGLSLEGLAQKADVDLRSLVLLERTGEVVLSKKAIGRLAETLGLPVNGLTEVAGIDDQRSERIEEAMYYFAARAETNSRLSEAEEYAFNELVKVISDQ